MLSAADDKQEGTLSVITKCLTSSLKSSCMKETLFNGSSCERIVIRFLRTGVAVTTKPLAWPPHPRSADLCSASETAFLRHATPCGSLLLLVRAIETGRPGLLSCLLTRPPFVEDMVSGVMCDPLETTKLSVVPLSRRLPLIPRVHLSALDNLADRSSVGSCSLRLGITQHFYCSCETPFLTEASSPAASSPRCSYP